MNPKKVNEKLSSDRLYQFSCLYNRTESREVACTRVTAYVLVREGSITLFLKSDEK